MARRRWRFLQTQWIVGLAATLLVWLALPFFVPGEPNDRAPKFLVYIFAAVAAHDMGWIFWFKRMMRTRAAGARSVEELVERIGGLSMVNIALAQGFVIMAVILFVATRNRSGLSLMCAIALLGLYLSRPSLEEWRDVLPSLPAEW